MKIHVLYYLHLQLKQDLDITSCHGLESTTQATQSTYVLTYTKHQLLVHL
jgi:hypothetical protein